MDELKKLLENAGVGPWPDREVGVSQPGQQDDKLIEILGYAYDMIESLAQNVNDRDMDYDDVLDVQKQIADYMDGLGDVNEAAGEGNAMPEDQLAQQIAASIWNWTVTSNGEYSPYVSDSVLEKVNAALFQMQKNAGGSVEDDLSLVPMDEPEQAGLDVAPGKGGDPWGLGK